MAKSTIENREKEVVTTITEKVVHLELTTEEAVVLCVILDRIGGIPSSPRGVSDNIRDELDKYISSSTEEYINVEDKLDETYRSINFILPKKSVHK